MEECDPDPLLLVPLPAISRFFEATPAARRGAEAEARQWQRALLALAAQTLTVSQSVPANGPRLRSLNFDEAEELRERSATVGRDADGGRILLLFVKP